MELKLCVDKTYFNWIKVWRTKSLKNTTETHLIFSQLLIFFEILLQILQHHILVFKCSGFWVLFRPNFWLLFLSVALESSLHFQGDGSLFHIAKFQAKKGFSSPKSPLWWMKHRLLNHHGRLQKSTKVSWCYPKHLLFKSRGH